LHIINTQLKNNTICNSIEEAQPFLKTCLISINGTAFNSTQRLNTLTPGTPEEQFASILSGSDSVELDKNLLCPRCHYIVVNAVECRSCQYIICLKCA